MKAKQLVTAALLSMAASIAFADQGEHHFPAPAAAHATAKQQGTHDSGNVTPTPIQGKTRAEVRAELKDFSYRNTQE